MGVIVAQVERSSAGLLHDAGHQKNKFRREAEECRRSAKRPIDRKAWLRLAVDWMKLARGEDLRIKVAGLKGTARFHRDGPNRFTRQPP
jgi:hypothetical protein